MILQLEINGNFKKSNDIIKCSRGTILFTPQLGTDNSWLFRVQLSKKQSIVGFPKFMIIGIGFSNERMGNTNLPYTCSPEKIFNHIKDNKGSKKISDSDCITAIKMVSDAAIEYKALWKGLWN